MDSELIKTIRETAHERIKNPLLASYLIAFLVWNWRAITYFIFSSDSLPVKMEALDEKYWPVESCWFGCNLPICFAWFWIAPLLIALIYVFGVPYLSLWVDSGLSHSEKKKNEQIHNKTLESLDRELVIADKQRKVANVKAGGRTIEDFQQEVSLLSNDNAQLSSEVEKLRSTNARLKDTLEREQKQYSEILKEHLGKIKVLENTKSDLESFENYLLEMVRDPSNLRISELAETIDTEERLVLLTKYAKNTTLKNTHLSEKTVRRLVALGYFNLLDNGELQRATNATSLYIHLQETYNSAARNFSKVK